MARVVRLNDVWRMLDNCLPGYERKESDHYWTVKYGGRSFRTVPLGAHGRRQNPEIESGYIRSLVRFFSIDQDCVRRFIDLT
jgi:hypothetical protein